MSLFPMEYNKDGLRTNFPRAMFARGKGGYMPHSLVTREQLCWVP